MLPSSSNNSPRNESLSIDNSVDGSSSNDNVFTKALLWKQGRGRSLSFIKPWRERLVVVDHKKMILSYYQVPEGCDWVNSPPAQDTMKGTIPLQEAIIEDLRDVGRPHAFAVLNGDVHVNLACSTETQKTQWMALLQNISQLGRTEANKEKFQRLHQMGTAQSTPSKLLKQNSRNYRGLTQKPSTSTTESKDLSDDESDVASISSNNMMKSRPISYDRSRSPSPTPPTPPPRPLSKVPIPSPPPPSALESTDADEIFQLAVLSAALDKSVSSPEPTPSSSSLAIHIEISQQQNTTTGTHNQDVNITEPDLNQLLEEQKKQERQQRMTALLEQEEEQRKIDNERRQKEKEVEEKTNEIQGKLSEYRRTTFRDIAHVETEKAQFEKLKSTMTDREAAHLIAEQGEQSIYVQELKKDHQHHSNE